MSTSDDIYAAIARGEQPSGGAASGGSAAPTSMQSPDDIYAAIARGESLSEPPPTRKSPTPAPDLAAKREGLKGLGMLGPVVQGDHESLAIRRGLKALADKHGVKITSGYRDPDHNAKIGGAKGSKHTRKDEWGQSQALDFSGAPKAMDAFAREALKLYRGNPWLDEFFYTPVATLRGGKPITLSPSRQRQHRTHIHAGFGQRPGTRAAAQGKLLGPPQLSGAIGALRGEKRGESPYAQAGVVFQAEAALPAEARALVEKARRGETLTVPERRKLDRAREQVAVNAGQPLPAREVRRRKLFGPGTVNPRTLMEANPPQGLGALASGLEEALAPASRKAAAESYERYRNRVAQGKAAAPPAFSDKPEERQLQEADLARIREWANRPIWHQGPNGLEEWRNAGVRGETAFRPGSEEAVAFMERMVWLKTPAAWKELGVTTRFGKQLLRAMADERLERFSRAGREAKVQAEEGALNVGLALGGPALETALAGKIAAPVVSRLGATGAKVAPGAVAGAVEGGAQQVGTALLSGERDPLKLAGEAAVGTVTGGALGAAGNLLPGDPNAAELLVRQREAPARAAAAREAARLAAREELAAAQQGLVEAAKLPVGKRGPALKVARVRLAQASAAVNQSEGAVPVLGAPTRPKVPVEPPAGTQGPTPPVRGRAQLPEAAPAPLPTPEARGPVAPDLPGGTVRGAPVVSETTGGVKVAPPRYGEVEASPQLDPTPIGRRSAPAPEPGATAPAGRPVAASVYHAHSGELAGPLKAAPGRATGEPTGIFTHPDAAEALRATGRASTSKQQTTALPFQARNALVLDTPAARDWYHGEYMAAVRETLEDIRAQGVDVEDTVEDAIQFSAPEVSGGVVRPLGDRFTDRLRQAGYDAVIDPDNGDHIALSGEVLGQPAAPSAPAAPKAAPRVTVTGKDGIQIDGLPRPLTFRETDLVVQFHGAATGPNPDGDLPLLREEWGDAKYDAVEALYRRVDEANGVEPLVRAHEENRVRVEAEESAREQAEYERESARVREEAAAQAEDRASAAGKRAAGTATWTNPDTGRKSTVTYTNAADLTQAERETLWARVPAAKQGREYTLDDGSQHTLRDLILDQGIIPDKLGIKLDAKPAPQSKVTVTKRELPEGAEADPLDALEQRARAAKAALDAGEEVATVGKRFQSRLAQWEKTLEDRVQQGPRISADTLGLQSTYEAAKYLANLAALGAVKMARGLVRKSEWTAAMLQEFGEDIRPHLDALWNTAKRVAGDELWDDDPDAMLRLIEADLRKHNPAPKSGTPELPDSRTRKVAVAPKEQAPRPDPERTTGLANRVQDEEVLRGLIREPEKGTSHLPKEWHDRGKALVEAGDADYDLLARQIGSGETPMTAEHVGVLLYGKAEKLKGLQRLRRRLDLALAGDDPQAVRDASAAYEAAQADLQTYLDDVQKGKTGWHNVGMALQAGTDLDTGNFVEVLAEARRRKGGKLAPKVEAELTRMSREVEAARAETAAKQAEVDHLQRVLAERNGELDLNAVADVEQRKARKARKTRQTLIAEEQAILQEFDDLLKEWKGGGRPSQPKLPGMRSGAVVNVPYEAARLGRVAGKLFLKRIQIAGATLEGTVASVVKTLAERGVAVTRDQVLDDVAALKKPVPRVPKDDAAIRAQIRKLEKEALEDARLREEIRQLEEGVLPKVRAPKRREVVSAQIDALRKRRAELLKGLQPPKPPKPPKPRKPRAKRAKISRAERLRSQIADLQAGKIPPVKARTPLTPEEQALKAERDRLLKEKRPPKPRAKRVRREGLSLEERLRKEIADLRAGKRPVPRTRKPVSLEAERLMAERSDLKGQLRARDEIARLQAGGKPAPKTRKPVSPELARLREERDLLRKGRRLDDEIAQLERDLKANTAPPRSPGRSVHPLMAARQARRDELAKQLAAKRREQETVGRLLGQIATLEAGGTLPKRPAKKPTGQQAALLERRADLQRQQAVRQKIAELENQLGKARPDYQPAKARLRKASRELEDLRTRQQLLEREVLSRIQDQKSATLLDWVGIIRVLRTAWDFSAPGRQGLLLSVAHPVSAAHAFVGQMKALSPRQAQKMQNALLARPNAALYQRSGLYLSSMGKGEEVFRGRGARLLGKAKFPYEAAERAYSAYLNRVRADSFDQMVKALGPNPQDADLKAIANYINVASGRGGKALEDAGFPAATRFLSEVLFSPRFLASRFEYALAQPLTTGAKGASWKARGLVAKEYAKTIAALGAAIAMAKFAGAQVSTDPTNSDFLKVRIGDTRIDLLAGEQQGIVLLSRLGTGKFTSPTGKVTNMREAKFGYTDTWDVMAKFLRSKLAPALGNTINLIGGKDPLGTKYELRHFIVDSLAAMSPQEVVEAAVEDGWDREDFLVLANFLGFSTQRFKPGQQKRERPF